MFIRRNFLIAAAFFPTCLLLTSLPLAGQMAKVVNPVAANALTVVPALVSYSAVAVDSDGKPLVSGNTGEISMTFLIYKGETGGEPLWVESQRVVVAGSGARTGDQTGHYTVQLGGSSPSGIPLTIFASGEARWLEVQIAGQKPQPRVLLASVPYAAKAADAATLGGLPASAFMLAASPSGADAAASGAGPDSGSNVTTTGGTSAYLPKFNGASTVVSSEIYDSGTSVGIGDVPNAGAKLDVNGPMIMRGSMTVSRTGNATASKGYPSYGFDFYSNAYNSSTKAADNPHFILQSEPVGNDTATTGATFNLLYSNHGSTPAETGFYVDSTGILHFASGQTFPGGSGTITGVTAGTGLSGGGTSGTVTLKNTGLLALTAGSGLKATSGQSPTLTVDTTKIPTLTDSPAFSGSISANNSANGGVAITGSASGSESVGVLGTASGAHSYGVQGIAEGPADSNNLLPVGVYGLTTGDFGVVGTATTGTAVAAFTGTGTAVYATATTGTAGYFANVESDGIALYSQNTANYDKNASIYPIALYGYANGTRGIGTSGVSIAGTGVVGIDVAYSDTGTFFNDGSSAGTWGDTSAAGGGSVLAGIVGFADDNSAGEFVNNSSTYSTLEVANGADGGPTGLFKTLQATSREGTCGIGSGALTCTGQIKTLASTNGGARKVEMYAMQSPENWAEDFGSGSLNDGVATIAIDPAFAETANTSADYHVFLTPRGDSKGLYVSAVTATGFEVHESGGGTASLAFDYRIVAKRRGYEAQRMTDVTESFAAETAIPRQRMQAMDTARANHVKPRSLAVPRDPMAGHLPQTPGMVAVQVPAPHK